MLNRLTLSVIILAGGPQLSIGQEAPNALARIERLAVETAIRRAEVAQDRPIRVVIDPMVVRGDEAPGDRDVTTREPSRQEYLVRSLGAKSLPRRSVIDCTVRPCIMRDTDLLVTLSEPQLTGDSASLTVTTLRPIAKGAQYITIKVFLHKEGAAWKVARVEELGIS